MDRRVAGLVMLLCALPLAAAERYIEAGDVRLAIRHDDQVRFDPNGEPWEPWLATSVEAVTTVTGRFPLRAVDIQLQGTNRASEAVAFGQVRRSSPPRIRFYVDPHARLKDLEADWRGYHEFAHLLIPFPGNDDIWFTEGLASYYQYLLQARVGVVDPERAWRNLHAGFERGLDDSSGRGQSLRRLSPRMWRERAFRRVYWTGAAFFLRVDTRLRNETDGRHSLDSTLAAFHDCCLHQRRRWSARELIEKFGELSIAPIWQQEYRATIDRPAAPRFASAYERLGIRASGARLRFSDEPGRRRLREAIAGPSGAAMQRLADRQPDNRDAEQAVGHD